MGAKVERSARRERMAAVATGENCELELFHFSAVAVDGSQKRADLLRSLVTRRDENVKRS